MKILFYEERHFSPNFHEFTGSKTILPKKIAFFSPKIGEKKICHGPLSHWCREGKTLVVRPLKKHFFYVCLPLVSWILVFILPAVFSLPHQGPAGVTLNNQVEIFLRFLNIDFACYPILYVAVLFHSFRYIKPYRNQVNKCTGSR